MWCSAPRTEAGLESMDNLKFVCDRQGQLAASYGVYKANANVAFRQVLHKIYKHQYVHVNYRIGH